jgi:hypothetical protein
MNDPASNAPQQFESGTRAPRPNDPAARFWIRIVGWSVVIAMGMWGLLATILWLTKGAVAASRFGDNFGFVNSLFAALALVGVEVAIILQIQELKLQRKELRASRKEMKRSTTAQQVLEEALTQQVRFFSLTAYMNALNTAIEAYDDMLKRSTEEHSRHHLLFRQSLLRQEVAFLMDQLRPFAVQFVADSPASAEHIVARLLGCSDYLRNVPEGWRSNAKLWYLAFDDVADELTAIASLAQHVPTARNAVVSERDRIRYLLTVLPKEGTLSNEQRKFIDDAVQHFEVVRVAVCAALGVI